MRDLLGELGYSDTLLHEDYAFSGNSSAERKGDYSLNRVDLAAFSQTLPNFRTACIGVSFSPDETSETLTRFRPFGAPLIFSISPNANHAEYWRMSAIAPPKRIDGVELDDILQLFNERKHQWSPDAIERAKAIGFQNGVDQLDFFDAGYLPALASELSKKLERDLNKMLGMCKKQFLAQHTEEAFEAATESIFRLLFRLLAAKYLIDRRKQPAWN